MRLSIRARDVKWTPELQDSVERRIEFAVDRHKQRVSDVSVYIADLNGPKGGVDKLCQITASLRDARNPFPFSNELPRSCRPYIAQRAASGTALREVCGEGIGL
jgi:hypothetical protein